MHEFSGEYKENNCGIQITGNEPYIVLNLEVYCNKLGLSHCDFMYIYKSNDEYYLFVVELKDITAISKNKLERIINDAVNNKFPQTNSMLQNILDFLNIAIPSIKFYAVLVLPPEVKYKCSALISHFKNKFTTLKKKGFNDAWMAPCGGSIWDRI